ncbi:NADP-dependent malic enzyme [Candidatus Peregrinibacteria bacterium]|nr:MAG: NADP-dependent malic enzyme [Candidatus Peregrinibacteria bacterium]
MSSDFDAASLALHREHKGKLGVYAKVPVKNKQDLSTAYTPGVGAVSLALAENAERMYELSPKGNTVAVVSDGSAVLGLGNIGSAGAYPVMEGKALLFKTFADVDAYPIVVKTQNVDEIVELVCNIADGFGGINLEDISAPRCFEIEEKLKARLKIPVFHDDQHGTAIVVLAGLINALKVVEKNEDISIVVNGAGAAGIAITDLLLEYGFTNIVLVDTQGALVEGRKGMNSAKEAMARRSNPHKKSGALTEVMVGADVLIGVSKAGLVSSEMVHSMAEKAIVFAMANPVPEITEEEARAAGALITATGRSDSTNQLNNVLVFPGIFRGALDARIHSFTNAMFLRAAEALASLVKDPHPEKIIPSPFEEGVAEKIAQAIQL